jgi:hypothetical protein
VRQEVQDRLVDLDCSRVFPCRLQASNFFGVTAVSVTDRMIDDVGGSERHFHA